MHVGLVRAEGDRRLADPRAIGQRHGVRDDAGQLGQVARPIVIQQALPGLRGKAPGGLPRLDALCGQGLLQVVFHQRLEVLPTLAQGRDPKGGDVQQVVEAAIETAFGHRRLQVAGGGSDQPHIRRRRLSNDKVAGIGPEKNVEQADLGPKRQALDVDQEEGSAAGRLQQPRAVRSAFLDALRRVAEEDGLQFRLVDPFADDVGQGRAGPAAPPVDGLGHQIPSRARFAAEEDRDVGGGDFRHEDLQGTHRRTLGDQGDVGLLGSRRQRRRGPEAAARASQRPRQRFVNGRWRKGPRQVIARPQP